MAKMIPVHPQFMAQMNEKIADLEVQLEKADEMARIVGYIALKNTNLYSAYAAYLAARKGE